jgi:hypothetical protein
VTSEAPLAERFEGLAFRLLDVRLAHVRAQVWANNEERPEWASAIKTGEDAVMNLAGLDDHVMAQLRVRIAQERIAIDIALQGLYEVSEGSSVLLPRDEGDHRWMVQRIPEEDRAAVIDQAATDLYPYLRHHIAELSSQLDQTSRIVLTPPSKWVVRSRG